MDSSVQCKGKKVNVVKFASIILLAAVIFIYSIMLFTGSFGRVETKVPQKSTDPKEIETAENVLNDIFIKNSYLFVKDYSEEEGYLVVRVDGIIWKKSALNKRKDFIKTIAHAKETLGVSPKIKIKDSKNNTEYASFENNRISLADFSL
ncbi:MAG: hypothetical protein H7844_08175 [Nitrospirae bacterium YQR-1]